MSGMNRIFNRNSLLAATAATELLLLCASPARAQDAPPPAPAAVVSSDIVVTARRREERLQDVPVAVSVLTGQAIQQAGIQRFEDLQRSVPALQIQAGYFGNATPTFTIRSQRNGNNPITIDPSVSIYLAEVPEARAQGLSGGMFDLSSVQVLKGPQGTLFGRNTTGGAVVLTPAAPTDKFEGYGRVTVGNYNTHNFEAVVNAPLADWAQLRVGGLINRHDGYVKNLNGGRLNNANNESWRVSLKLTPFDGFRNTTVLNGWHADETGPASRPLGAGPIATLLFPTFAATVARDMALPFHTVENDQTSNYSTSFLASNITEYDVTPELTIKNVFGYRFVRAGVQTDIDGSDLPVYIDHNFVRSRQYSDELQLNGKAFDGALNYIIGAFYFREKAFEDDISYRPGPGLTGALVPITIDEPIGDVDNTSKSLFAQGTLRVPGLEGLSLTAGGRYTWDTRKLIQYNQGGEVNPVTGVATKICELTGPTGAPLNPCFRSQSTNFHKFTYTLAVDYKITNDILVYVTHRSGYRSGGWNSHANPVNQAVPFSPENVKDYEVGFKSEFRLGEDVRARFNIAAYYQDYRDIQRSVGFVNSSGSLAGSRIENAANAHVKGVEPELTLFLGKDFSINGYYSYSHGKYLHYLSANRRGGFDDLSPAPFAGAPEHSGGVNVSWTLPVARDQGEVTLIGNFYAQSKTYGSDNTYFPATGIDPFNIIPAYHLVNARLEWNHILNTGFSAAIYAKNMFNEKYLTGALGTVNVGLGTADGYIGDPRTFGGEVTFRW